MTVKGGTAPACAACAYQRRKCSPTCPLAPYFPANHPKVFRSVHRLFGVSNVTKTLEKLNANQKDDAMRSIIYEAEMRERFPVEGCCGVIAYLSHQLHLTREELHCVCTSLQAYREEMAVVGSDDKVVGRPSTYCWSDLDAATAQFGQFSLNNGNGDDTVDGLDVETKIEGK